jgi:hypothetical protein
VRSEAQRLMQGAQPAIVVVGPRGELRAITAAAQDWQERFDQIAPGRFMVIMQLMAGGARTATSGGFRARLRDARGQWAVLKASPLIGGDDDQIAVTVEPASGDQLLGLLLAAYGLTAREREVCGEVINGHSTSDIARPPVHLQQYRTRSSKVDLRQGRRTEPWRTRRPAAA